MKLFKNDNRKEMTNNQAKIFSIVGIGAMLLIATPTFISPIVAYGIMTGFSIAMIKK